jgi:hypothetical protein
MAAQSQVPCRNSFKTKSVSRETRLNSTVKFFDTASGFAAKENGFRVDNPFSKPIPLHEKIET